MTYYFDMDGTLADFYGVRNWLDYLRNKDTYPYEVARPLHRFASLARMLNRVQAEGNRIGIISWGAENTPCQYNREIAEAKRRCSIWYVISALEMSWVMVVLSKSNTA